MAIDGMVDISGIESAVSILAGVQGRAKGWSEQISLSIALLVQADVDRRFDSSPKAGDTGAVYGGITWAALTDKYLKANPRREGGQQLRDTGELQQSFQASQSGNVFRVTDNSVTIGSNLPKAAGLNNKRPLLVLTQELSDGAAAIIQNYLLGGE